MSTRGSYFLAVVASLLVTAPACSGKSSNTPTPAGPSGETTADKGSTAGAPPGAQVLGTPHIREPFTFTITYTDSSEPTKLQVTVNSVTCGKPLDQKVIASAADSVGEPTPTPKPESGKQFCVLLLEVGNVGDSKATWDANDTVSLNVGTTRYTQTQDGSNYASDYAQYWAKKGRTGPSFGLQPGSKGPTYGVFEIPVSATPTTLWVTSGTAIENIDGIQPGYLVRL